MKALMLALVSKTGSVLVAVFILITILQIFVGRIFDLAFDIIFIALLTGAAKLEAIKRWLGKE